MIIEIKTSGPVFDGRFSSIVDKEFRWAMTDSIFKLENEISRNTPVYFGILRAGIQGQVISPFNGRVGVVGPATKYGDIVENGRNPGRFPPIDAIRLWVRRKLKPKNVRSVAFLVARKIAEEGTEGKFMFRNAEKKLKRWVVRRFEQAIRRVDLQVSDK